MQWLLSTKGLSSFNNRYTILTIVKWSTEINPIFIVYFEGYCEGVIRYIIFYKGQLALYRVYCESYYVSFIIKPRYILLIEELILWPTIAVIRYLKSSMTSSWLKFESILFCFLSNSYSNSNPSFYSLHLEFYGSFFIPYMRLY